MIVVYEVRRSLIIAAFNKLLSFKICKPRGTKLFSLLGTILHKGNNWILNLRNNSTLFQELEVSIVNLTVANVVLPATLPDFATQYMCQWCPCSFPLPLSPRSLNLETQLASQTVEWWLASIIGRQRHIHSRKYLVSHIVYKQVHSA